MHLEEFSYGNSTIHKLDSRVKIIVFLTLLLTLIISENSYTLLELLIVSLLLVLVSRINLKAFINRMVLANIFVLLLWVMLPFSIAGKPAFSILGWNYSVAGIEYTRILTIRINTIIILTIVLVGTIPIFKIANTLSYFKIPNKLVYLFFFCYRAITILHKEVDMMKHSLQMRGFVSKTSVRTYRVYGILLGMTLVKAYDRSRRVYQAMLCRGFRGDFYPLYHQQIDTRDIIFIILSTATECLIIYFNG